VSRFTVEEFRTLMRDHLPVAVAMGVEPLEFGAGYAELRLPYHDDLLRPGGTVNGPALMTLADIAMYAAVFTAIGRAELAVTTSLTINFLRKPPRADVIAKARMLKLGKRLAVGEVELYSEGDAEMVAHVTATYSIPPDRSR